MGNGTDNFTPETPTTNPHHPMTLIASALIFAGLITSVIDDIRLVKTSRRLTS
jgi:hypothetical protein